MHGTPLGFQGWPRPVLLNSYQASMQKFQGNRPKTWFWLFFFWMEHTCFGLNWPWKHLPYLFSRQHPGVFGPSSHGNWEPAIGGTKPCTTCAAVPGHSSNNGPCCKQHGPRKIHVNLSYRWQSLVGRILAYPFGLGYTSERTPILPSLLIHLSVAGLCPYFSWKGFATSCHSSCLVWVSEIFFLGGFHGAVKWNREKCSNSLLS